MITPVGVQTPRGKKKGKVFVDDQVCLYSFRFEVWVEMADFWGVGEYDDYSCDCQCGEGRTD